MRREFWVSFLCGVVFAVGLGIGGMTQPAKVIGFLDFAGHWDPSLALVMVGAVGVYAAGYCWVCRRSLPWSLPSRTDVDSRLLGGAALFGVGWGIAGFCPGPALTSLASGQKAVVVFVAGMLAGMLAYKVVEGLGLRSSARASDAPSGRILMPERYDS